MKTKLALVIIVILTMVLGGMALQNAHQAEDQSSIMLPTHLDVISADNVDQVAKLIDEELDGSIALIPHSTRLIRKFDGIISILDYELGEADALALPKQSMYGHFVVNPDGSQFAVIDTAYKIRFWSISENRELPSLSLQDEAYSLAYSPDGLRLAIDYKNTVQVWDLATRQAIHSFPDGDFAGFGIDGETIALLTPDRHVRIWDVQPGREIVTLALAGHEPRQVAYASGADENLAVFYEDNVIRLWSVSSGEVVQELQENNPVRNMAYSPDATLLVTVTTWLYPTELHFWDTTTGELLRTIDLGRIFGVYDIQFNTEGSFLTFSTCPQGCNQFWGVLGSG